MSKILTNSELPLCMFDENLQLNQYDFVLYHLLETNESYRNYYITLRETHPDRLMILDNSAYEFYVRGEECDFDVFVQWICKLRPDFYILPDTLMNFEKTVTDTWNFLEKYYDLIREKTGGYSKPMAVLQGNTVDTLLSCAEHYKNWGKIEAIAVPFHNSFFTTCWRVSDLEPFNTIYPEITKDIKYAGGRVAFLRFLNKYMREELNFIFPHVHLLGSHCPYEKHVISKMKLPYIKTMDTGYPVKCGYEGVTLFKETKKPDVIIDDFLEEDLDLKTMEIIRNNVKRFRDI